MSRRRRILLAVICISGVVGFAIKHLRHYVVLKRLAVVEPGELYRGGWQKPWPLRRFVRYHGVKTILNLACDPKEQDANGEGDVAREFSLNWYKILMPGTGLGTYKQLDEAAGILADPSNRPVFFHCAGGTHRTNMALAAYRMKYCGWTLEQVLVELRQFKFGRRRRKNQFEHLKGYIEHIQNTN